MARTIANRAFHLAGPIAIGALPVFSNAGKFGYHRHVNPADLSFAVTARAFNRSGSITSGTFSPSAAQEARRARSWFLGVTHWEVARPGKLLRFLSEEFHTRLYAMTRTTNAMATTALMMAHMVGLRRDLGFIAGHFNGRTSFPPVGWSGRCNCACPASLPTGFSQACTASSPRLGSKRARLTPEAWAG